MRRQHERRIVFDIGFICRRLFCLRVQYGEAEMKVNLKIPIECGENVCNASAVEICAYKTIKYGIVPYCRLFGRDLHGELRHDLKNIYTEYQRLEVCKEAQND